jgi:hypothetical protein
LKSAREIRVACAKEEIESVQKFHAAWSKSLGE